MQTKPKKMRSTLTRKLYTILFLSTLSILLSVGYGYHTIYRNGINRQMLQYAHNLLEDTTDSLSNYLADLITSAQATTMLPDVATFLKGGVNTRFALRDTIRAQLASYVNFKHGVANIYMRSAQGTRVSASPENTSAYSTEVFLVYLRAQREYDLSKPFRDPVLTPCYTGNRGNKYFCLLVPIYQTMIAPRNEDYLGAFVIICEAAQLSQAVPISVAGKLLIAEGDQALFDDNPYFRQSWLMSSEKSQLWVDGKPANKKSIGKEEQTEKNTRDKKRIANKPVSPCLSANNRYEFR